MTCSARGTGRQRTRWAKNTKCTHCHEHFESGSQLHHHLREIKGITENNKKLKGKSWADIADEEDDELAAGNPRNWSPEQQASIVLEVSEDMDVVRTFLM